MTAADIEARRIHAAILGLYRGRDIGQDDEGFYARPRLTKPAGPAKNCVILLPQHVRLFEEKSAMRIGRVYG